MPRLIEIVICQRHIIQDDLLAIESTLVICECDSVGSSLPVSGVCHQFSIV